MSFLVGPAREAEIDRLMEQCSSNRRYWCGGDPSARKPGALFGCACAGCVNGFAKRMDISYAEWEAWTKRHPDAAAFVKVDDPDEVDPLTLPLAERLRRFRARTS